jgi:ankyrin repeat protein
MLASESRNSELVKLLLINGADPKRADSKGRRASDYAAAAARNANNVIKLLGQ